MKKKPLAEKARLNEWIGTPLEKLTVKERKFVENYTICGNGTKAAKAAGYSEESAYSIASENLRKPHIKTAITYLEDCNKEHYKGTHAQITAQLLEVLDGDITDFLEITGEGKAQTISFKPETFKKRGKGKLIESISIDPRGRITVKMESKSAAREMLAKHVGFYEADNKQKTPEGVHVYLPDNGRGTEDEKAED